MFEYPCTMACSAKAVVGVGPTAVSMGNTTMTLGSFRYLVVESTDAIDDGCTIGSPQS